MVAPVITADVPRIATYDASDGQTEFPIPFAYLAESDICVEVWRADALHAAYVGGDGNLACDPPADAALEDGVAGTATIPACEADDVVHVFAMTTPERDVIFANPADVTRENLNREANRRVAVETELRRDLGRALRAPIGEAPDELPSATERALMFLAFDAAGRPTAAAGASGSGTPVSAGWAGRLAGAPDAPKTVTTYGALKALTPSEGRIDGGRYRNVAYATAVAINDGAAGEWIYRAASATPDNGCTVLAANDGVGRYHREFTGDVCARWRGVQGDGADYTDALDDLIDAADDHGVGLFLDFEGIAISEDIVAPVTFRGMRGLGRDLTELRCKRVTHGAGAKLIQHVNPTVPVIYRDLRIDADDAEFSDCYVLWVEGASGHRCERVTIEGQGSYHFLNRNCTDLEWIDCESIATGASIAGFYGDGVSSSRRRVAYCKALGDHDYGVILQFGSGNLIEHCWAEDTGVGFAFSISYASDSKIFGGWSFDSAYEAYHFSDGINCEARGGFALWTTAGGDFGCSLNGGDGGICINCRHVGHVLINSYAAAGAIANNCTDCEIADLLARDCAKRGTAANPTGGHSHSLLTYTDFAGAACVRPTFRDNRIVASGGTISNGYTEVAGGGGTITGARAIHNLFSGTFTRPYGDLQTDTLVWSLNLETWTPTLTASSGSFTTTTAYGEYVREGQVIRIVQVQISITNKGTGASAMLFSLPADCAAVAPGGIGVGRESSLTGHMMSVSFSGAAATVVGYANGDPIQNGASFILSGHYRKAVA